MHTAWRKSIPAAVSALGLAASTVMASPASMATRRPVPTTPAAPASPAAPSTASKFWPWSKSTPTTTPMTSTTMGPMGPTMSPAMAPTMAPAPVAPPMAAQGMPAWQTAQPAGPVIAEEPSAWKHPIQYMSAKVPFGKSKTSTHPVMPPAQVAPTQVTMSGPTSPTGPTSPEFFIMAAQLCEKQNDVPQARQNLQKALAMWPNNADLLRAAARMEDRQNNLPLAESLYQQAVTSNPQNAAALNDLGLCLAREGKLEPSLQVLEQAIRLQPDKSLYRNNAATVLVEMRQDQRALAHLAAVHNPADANFNLGQLLVDRGRPADATMYFQTALQLNPGMQQAQDALVKQGGVMNVAQQTPAATTMPAMVPQQVVPTAGPSFGTQQPQYEAGPQLGYPATARTPAVGASSYVPPYYVPPVASQPGRPLQR